MSSSELPGPDGRQRRSDLQALGRSISTAVVDKRSSCRRHPGRRWGIAAAASSLVGAGCGCESSNRHLGYESNEDLKVHWLLPGKTLADGLRLIVSDTDTNVMATCAEDVKNLIVYFVHEDMFREVDWDDVVANPVTELPKTNLDNIRVDQAVDSEDDVLWDSDNEIEEGDTDLFDALVTSHVQVKDHKKAKGNKLKTLEISRPVQGSDEEDTNDEGLDLPESDGEGDVRLRFSSFNGEDMQNLAFHVGLVFADVQKLRDAITEYTIRNRVEIKMPRNEKARLKAHCAEGCPL
ncbi:uncharacterized protein [Miscanthus floridulus]|uniref:uncharacterized protein n=1 Tax=Miscanthus floridulus TaxID=154761 RepID=UPI00345AB202